MYFATEFWLTRLCFQRALGGIYLISFLIAANQFISLVGEHGLQPVQRFLRDLSFRRAPSLFYINCSDRFITATVWCGIALSIFAISGLSESFGIAVSMVTWALLWMICLSLVNVGQTFCCGWEKMLCETGFLAIFLGSSDTRPPVAIMWLIVWVLFRIMFGAGISKVQADPCWRDLTCLFYHYETQPLPNPVSWYLHHSPRWVHKAGVLFTHFSQLIVPWFYFAPAPICYWAGALTILFQIVLILSGNFSWLNYIVIVLCIPCFDDRFLARWLSIPSQFSGMTEKMSFPQEITVICLLVLVLYLSIRPAQNLFSRRQRMSGCFEPLHLVNTYVVFGAVTRERLEVVIQCTNAECPDASAEWHEYEFKGKPGNVYRRPCVVSPYHWGLDWQMWFAAMSSPEFHPWILTLMQKLLEGEERILRLLAHNPFPNASPKFIRADLYRYRFSEPGERAWWRRIYVSEYLPPMTLRRREVEVYQRLS